MVSSELGKMKIGFDVSQTGALKTGCGYLANSLITEIANLDNANEYTLFRTFGNFYWDIDFKNINPIQQSNYKEGVHHFSLMEAESFWKKPAEMIQKELGGLDILHSNNYFCPDKKLSGTKIIYTLYDLSFIENLEWTTEQNRYFCFDNVFNASLYADHIVSISEYSKQHFLMKFPHYPEEDISVVYPASRYELDESIEKPTRFSEISALSSGKFWLKTGTIEPRKNHQRLLQAYAQLKAIEKNVLPLVLVGKQGWMMDDFNEMIIKLGLEQDVIWLEYVSDEELQWLYQNCFCFLYPSLFEGFGLPVLEAMSCGAAVITSNTSSIPEITDNAAILVDPNNTDELFEAMQRLSKNEPFLNVLRKRSLARAKVFSWKKNAEKMLEIYGQLSVAV